MGRIKVLTISDHPMFHSGVAHTMRNIILALLKSDKFDVEAFCIQFHEGFFGDHTPSRAGR